MKTKNIQKYKKKNNPMIYEKDHIIRRSNRKHPLDLITNRNMQILTIDTSVLLKTVNHVLLSNQDEIKKYFE